MTYIVAFAGAVLLVLAAGGGIPLKTSFLERGQPVPQGDRRYALLLGAVLVAIAAVVEEGSSRVALWAALGALGGIVAAYAVFLWRTEPSRRGSQRDRPGA